MNDAHLHVALEALEKGDRGVALDALLSAWREHRCAALADLLTSAGEEAARGLEPVTGRTREDFQQAWIDLANRRRACDVPRLLNSLEHPPWTKFPDRLDRLDSLPDDPRLALRIARFLEERPVLSSLDNKVWRRMGALVERTQDVRCWGHLQRGVVLRGASTVLEKELLAPMCQRLADAPPPTLEEPERALLDKLYDVIHRLSRGPKATDAQLEPPRTTSPKSAEELLAAVYASPTDDAPRRVFADWLLSQGDPRGELIVSQLSGERSARILKRERDALKANGTRWLGPLEPVVERKGMRFERGFLAAAAPRFRTAAQREALIDHPAWSTVTELIGPEQEMLPLFHGCALLGLTRIDCTLNAAGFAALGHRDRPLPSLSSLSIGFVATWKSESPTPFPALRELRVQAWGQDASLDWVFDGPMFQGVRRLIVEDRANRLVHWATRFPRVDELVIAPPQWERESPLYTIRDGELDVTFITYARDVLEKLRDAPGVFRKVRLHLAKDQQLPALEIPGLDISVVT